MDQVAQTELLIRRMFLSDSDKMCTVLVRHRVFRDSCVAVEGNYLKDLNVLGRDLTETVIVDNSPQAFGFQVCCWFAYISVSFLGIEMTREWLFVQLDNGIPIESWFEDSTDSELVKLLDVLKRMREFHRRRGDVRPFVRDTFRLYERVASACT